MNAMDNFRKCIIFAAILVLLVPSSCAPATQLIPTETAVPDTPTSTSTFTPEPTFTQTATPLPTATSTPAETPTQIPEVTPPAQGKGNVVGLVLWNNQPVPKAAIGLCRKFRGSRCSDYRTTTDENGYYVFHNVKPDRYIVAINTFNSNWWIFYLDEAGSEYQTVPADNNLVLKPWSIWKVDLHIIYPSNRKVIHEASPNFQWDAYPEAAYYQFSMYQFSHGKYNSVIEKRRTEGTNFTPDKPLVNCQYFWTVEAFNAQGIKIAEIPPVRKYPNYPSFTVTGLQTSCQGK